MRKIRFVAIALIAVGFGYSDLLVRPILAHPDADSHQALSGSALNNHYEAWGLHSHSDILNTAVQLLDEFIAWVASGGEPPHFVPQGPTDDTVSYPNLPSSNTGDLGTTFETVESTVSNDIPTNYSESQPAVADSSLGERLQGQ